MAVVREDVVKLSFEFDSKQMNKANDAVDSLLENTQELGGKNGTGKAEDGFDDAAKAAKKFGNTDLSKLSDGIDKIVSGVGKFALGVGKTAFKGIATAAAAGTTALVALGTAAVNGYAEFEQLKGGVDTLFGAGAESVEEYTASVGKSTAEIKAFQKANGLAVDGIIGPQTTAAIQKQYAAMAEAPKTVLKNANDAYKNAGMSANEYMSTVTSFSASLISSLGGDTAKAADYADRAIIDMADNANKMGTDIGMIQNAYQGFAKQNYTMLDNLKLGYGGTKEEMERLIKDASKMKDVQEKLGITVDENSMSFANVVNAISVMQEEMGIAGTTAEEASETIQGSALAMKAAWSNFLTGMANEDADFDQLLDNLVESVQTFLKNIIPRIKKMLPRLVRGLTEITKVIGKELPGILEDLLPSLIDGAMDLLGSLGDVLVSNIPMFKNIGLSLAKMLYKGITGKEMPTEMFDSLKTKLDEVCEAVGKIVDGVVDFGKQLWVVVGPALAWIADLALDAFVWIGDNINWILPVLGSLLGAMLAFKAVKKVTGIVKGFMGLFGLAGKGGAGAAAGGASGAAGGGGIGGMLNYKSVGTAMGGIATAIGGIAAIIAVFGALKQIPGYDEFMADGGDALKQLCDIISDIALVGAAFVGFVAVVGKTTGLSQAATGIGDIAVALLGMEAIVAAFAALAQIEGYTEFMSGGGEALKQLCGIIEDIGLVGAALTGFVAVVGVVPFPVVLAGMENIALVLGGMELIIAAFAALAQIPGYTEFMADGGAALTQICNILGDMAGSIVGGFAEGVTASLPTIGQNLADFASSIQPMFDTFAGVDSAGLKDFSVALAALIAVIAGEKLVSVITGGINYGELGANLNTMASSLTGFFSTIMTFPDGGFEKATALFNCLAGISSMPKEGGVVGWFQGEVDYAKMATGLLQLSLTTGFFTAIMSIPDEAFAKATALFDCLAGIKSLPQDGGVVGWFMGEVDFAKISSGIQTLASAGMISALTTIAAIPAEGFASLTAMFDALAGIKQMPKEGGIASWFTGNASTALTTVAGALPGVATDIASFFKNIGGRTDFSAIKNLFETLGNIEINSDAAEGTGLFGLGQSAMESMGTGLSNFATNAADFFSAVDTYNSTTISDFFDAIGKAGELPSKLAEVDTALGTTLSNMVMTIETGMDSMKTSAQQGMAQIVVTISGYYTSLYSSGQMVMRGLQAGLLSMRASLLATARGIASEISSTINKALDVHSPSRVTFETGTYVGMGLNEGMRSMIPDIQVTAREVSNASIPYERYSPESSATYYSSSEGGDITTVSPVFNLTISGTQDDRATARRVKRYVAEAIRETFESLERKSYAVREV